MANNSFARRRTTRYSYFGTILPGAELPGPVEAFMQRAFSSYLIVALILAIPLTCAAGTPARRASAHSLQAGQRSQLHFGKATTTYDTAAPWANGVAAANLNGDGTLDLIVSNYCQTWGQYGCSGEGEVSVLLGNGEGSFQTAVTYSTAGYLAQSVAVGDLNGDGIPDIVAANGCSTTGWGCEGQTGAASILLGNGDGTLQAAAVYSSGGNYAFSAAIGDLTGNGVLDIAVANSALNEGESSVGVLLGNGDGTFQPAATYSTGGRLIYSVALGDVNGDGIPDLIVAGPYTGVGVFLGNGDGTFQPAVLYDSGGEYPYSVALADLRGIGVLDVVVANQITKNAIGVLLGNGDGTFQPAVDYQPYGLTPGGASGSLAIGDVNGDGIPDIVAVEFCPKFSRDELCDGTGQVNVMLGNGDGTFQKTVVYSSAGYYGSAVAIADVNGDGRPDLVVTNEFVSQDNYNTGTVAVLLNETSYTTKTTLTSSPNPSQVNQSVTFTATISSTPPVPNGEVVTFYNGATEIGTGPTTNGIATLTTSFSSAGKFTIKAAYPGDGFRKPSSGSVKQVVSK